VREGHRRHSVKRNPDQSSSSLDEGLTSPRRLSRPQRCAHECPSSQPHLDAPREWAVLIRHVTFSSSPRTGHVVPAQSAGRAHSSSVGSASRRARRGLIAWREKEQAPEARCRGPSQYLSSRPSRAGCPIRLDGQPASVCVNYPRRTSHTPAGGVHESPHRQNSVLARSWVPCSASCAEASLSVGSDSGVGSCRLRRDHIGSRRLS
jgi:hypothetical protein